MNKNAYIVTIRDLAGYGMTDENTIICDEGSLLSAIKSLINKDEKETSVIVRKCGLLLNEKDSDQFRVRAWGKTSGE